MTICRVVVAVEYLAESESGVSEWARIREKLPNCGVKVIEALTVVMEIEG